VKEITIKNTKLLFLYRTPFFKKTKFKTDNKELKNIVKALNIKDKKERITYIYNETVKALNEYYSDDLCNFINGQCIVQRENKKGKFNGCCRLCPFVTNKGCPSENISCKLIYCKTAIKNIKLIKISDIKITKCLNPLKRLVLRGNFFITKEEFIDDLCKSIITYPFKTIKRDIKRNIKKTV